MSYDENLRSISLDADATIGIYTGVPGQPGSAVPNSGMQYRALKITGRNQVGLCTAGTDLTVGVLQNKPQRPGASATVGYEGVTNVCLGGVCNAGDRLVPNASGLLVPIGATVVVAGAKLLLALYPGTVSGEIIPALFI